VSNEQEGLERLLGLRVRPGERVGEAGIFSCAGCGASERFTDGETACDCKHDEDQSEWIWSGEIPQG
jgi:hypothetical protein